MSTVRSGIIARETEPRFSIYEYPAYPFKATDRMTNLEL